MDEQTTANETAEQEQPQQGAEQPQGSEVDWKAEARKWERYAKENKAARDELDALKAAQMTEQEKLVKRAEDAERRLAEANAAIQHSKDVAEVAAESGVPASLLEFCADRDAMEAFAKQYGGAQQAVHAAAPAPATRIARPADVRKTNAEAFAEMFKDF